MQTLPTDPPPAPLTEYDGVEWVMTPDGGAPRRLRAVPGTEVAIHWLDLAEGLAPAQAAAAARLMLADASADPLSDMHVAVGRPERGLTPVVLAPNALMAEWMASDPDIVIPSPFLMPPPEAGFLRRETEGAPDYRGPAAAFSAEPALAALMIGDAPVAEAGEADLALGIAEAFERPAVNLRQGPFARRRQWRVDKGNVRRVALLALGLIAISLVLQISTIMRYSFAADRLETQAAGVAASSPAGGDRRPRFAPIASILFDTVRATPNVELSRIDYRPDGSLSAIVMADSPATLAAFRRQVEASGVSVEQGAIQSGARPSAELVLRPA